MKTKINDLKKEVLDAFNKEFGTDFKHFDELPTLIGSDLGEVDNEAEMQQKLDTFKCLWESKLELIETKRENQILKNKLQKALNDSKEIHVNHIFEKGLKNEEVLEMYKKDAYDWYIVSEYFSNHARLHLISAPSEDEALQDVYTYILENENDNDPDIEIQLTGVDKVELNIK